MLAAQAGGFVRMDDGISGADGHMLRFSRESHQQQIARSAVGKRDALKAWLNVQRLLKLPVCRIASVARYVEMPGADLARDMDSYACAINPHAGDPALVPESRTQALTGGVDNVISGHF
jgi:hypothetical protein|nr:hypothetical protein [Accumulibacter sp.]